MEESTADSGKVKKKSKIKILKSSTDGKTAGKFKKNMPVR